MTPAPPRPTDAPPFPAWDEPAADETVPPADGMRAIRRLLAIGGAAILAVVVVGVLSALV